MNREDYKTIRIERTLDEEIEEVLLQSNEFKTKTQFIDEAIKRFIEITRLKSTFSPVGKIYFKDFLTQCKWKVYEQAKEYEKERNRMDKMNKKANRKNKTAIEETEELRIKSNKKTKK